MHEYNINILGSSNPPSFGELVPGNREEGGGFYSAIILAVAHNEFLELNLKAQKDGGAVIYDVKGIIDAIMVDGRL